MIFLIDFENVKSAGLDGIDRLSEEDTVYIFYTNSHQSLSFDAHRAIIASGAKIVYFAAANGHPNALDFQLASFTGYLVAKSEDKRIFIISEDKGFGVIWHFWESASVEGLSIYCCPTITKALSRIRHPAGDTAAQLPFEEQPAEPMQSEEPVQSEEIAADEAADDDTAAEAAGDAARKAESTDTSQQNKGGTDAYRTILNTVKKMLSGTITAKKCDRVLDVLGEAKDKQQFYTGMTKMFGMEQGLAAYKILRTEYTGLKRLSENL